MARGNVADARVESERTQGPAAAPRFVDVALNRPLRQAFTYRIPKDLLGSVRPGMRVAVPFGRRREVGVVVRLLETTELDEKKLRSLSQVLDEKPVVNDELLELLGWLSDYYACGLGEALAAALPAALKREGGRRERVVIEVAPGVGPEALEGLEARSPKQHRVLRTLLEASGPLERAEIMRRMNVSAAPIDSLVKKGLLVARREEVEPEDLLSGEFTPRPRPERLTDPQRTALDALRKNLEAREFGAFLLHGVTGSGKTEVYLTAIEDALARGRGAIVLVPEIALTPQTVGWFRSRFDDIAVLHSRMTDTQRLSMWRRVQSGAARVVVGARSAIFAPVQDLGVVVVDEEHEPSFKQTSVPRYHARDVAVVRAKAAGAVCILGSATPSLESWRNAARGRYTLLPLSRRVHGGDMPPIEIVDLKAEKGAPLFSRRLVDLMQGTLERKEQAILFLNRRGFAPTLWCKECHTVLRCDQCDVALVYHRGRERVICHSCCSELATPDACPTCTAPALRFLGQGSEKVELLLAREFPDARVARMDSDTMLRREDYEVTLDAFGRGDLDVLVGTQMIAKGLDFPRVTLVGIVNADATLCVPDFRAAERTFQLVSQVAGRAGRGELEGRIVLQTTHDRAPCVLAASRHDYEAFASSELPERELCARPPFARLIRVVLDDDEEPRAAEAAQRFAAICEDVLGPFDVRVEGPGPAPVSQLRGRHRWHLLLVCSLEGPGLTQARELLRRLAGETNRPRVTIDVDPASLL